MQKSKEERKKRRKKMEIYFNEARPGEQYDGETVIVLQERYGRRMIRKAIYWASSGSYVAVDGVEKGNRLLGVTGWMDPEENYRAFGYSN